MTKITSSLNWEQRLAIINTLKPSDEQASSVLGVTVAEINTARESITPASDFDVEPFKAHFSKTTAQTSETNDQETDTATATSGTVVKKKRGRTGSKVATAFTKVTTEPQPLEAFAAANDVSVNVLRQTKRFAPGQNIKVGKKNDVTSIWIEEPEDETAAEA